MSLLPDLNPLIQQIKEFNINQIRTNQFLEQQNLLLTEIKEINSQIKQLLQNQK